MPIGGPAASGRLERGRASIFTVVWCVDNRRMGVLADGLDALVINAVSPDGNITAEVRDRERVDLWFAAGALRSYEPGRLAHELDQLAALIWVRHRRECLEIVEQVHRRSADPGELRPEARTSHLTRLDFTLAA
jgi:hypothetical protein